MSRFAHAAAKNHKIQSRDPERHSDEPTTPTGRLADATNRPNLQEVPRDKNAPRGTWRFVRIDDRDVSHLERLYVAGYDDEPTR